MEIGDVFSGYVWEHPSVKGMAKRRREGEKPENNTTEDKG